MSNQNNIRIAKNTIFLYLRMLLLMAISLYTSRVILKTLGIEDYGIYNLVASFITFFSFIGNALVSTMQRFFNTALGENDILRYKRVFSMSISIMILFSIIIFIIGETLGLWFVNSKLNIPENRYHAAIVVYHISLLTFIVNMLRTPFHASIVAHENMSFYAYLSIIESALRLGIVFLLPLFEFDKLIIYGILYCCIAILTNIPYIYYCHKRYPECKYTIKWDGLTFRELIGFSGWVLLGQSSVVLKNQGEAFLINRFFGVVANAAMGVASQVTAAVDMFVTNFQIAFKPQIVQTYASKEMDAHRNLIMRASKFSFYLMLIVSVPVITNLSYILDLWLVEVPLYAEKFILLILISHMINALGSPLVSSILACGNIKYYQIFLSVIFILGLLCSYIILKQGSPPYSVAIIAIVTQTVLYVLRVIFVRQCSKIALSIYFKQVVFPVVVVSIISYVMTYLLYNQASSVISLFLMVGIEVVTICISIYLLGLSNTEKEVINQYFIKLIHR